MLSSLAQWGGPHRPFRDNPLSPAAPAQEAPPRKAAVGSGEDLAPGSAPMEQDAKKPRSTTTWRCGLGHSCQFLLASAPSSTKRANGNAAGPSRSLAEASNSSYAPQISSQQSLKGHPVPLSCATLLPRKTTASFQCFHSCHTEHQRRMSNAVSPATAPVQLCLCPMLLAPRPAHLPPRGCTGSLSVALPRPLLGNHTYRHHKLQISLGPKETLFLKEST